MLGSLWVTPRDFATAVIVFAIVNLFAIAAFRSAPLSGLTSVSRRLAVSRSE